VFAERAALAERAGPAASTEGYCRAAIGRLPYPGAVETYAIAFAGGTPAGLDLAPDGSVWFTLPTENAVGHLVVTSTIDYTGEMIALPTAAAEPLGIAVSPDGSRVWIAEASANAISELNPTTGAVTEHVLARANARPTDVDVAPSGLVWFTEESGNRLASFDPGDGSVREYFVPTSNSAPHNLVVAEEDRIWFTEADAQKIGRFRPSLWPNPGTFVEVLSAGSRPFDIAVDALGDPWVTDIAGNKVGWFQAGTTQVFRWYTLLPGQVAPAGIAFDSSNRPWFTDAAGVAVIKERNVGTIERFAAPAAYTSPAGIAAQSDIVWFPTAALANCLYVPLIRGP